MSVPRLSEFDTLLQCFCYRRGISSEAHQFGRREKVLHDGTKVLTLIRAIHRIRMSTGPNKMITFDLASLQHAMVVFSGFFHSYFNTWFWRTESDAQSDKTSQSILATSSNLQNHPSTLHQRAILQKQQQEAKKRSAREETREFTQLPRC
jgi:hypothetical protein